MKSKERNESILTHTRYGLFRKKKLINATKILLLLTKSANWQDTKSPHRNEQYSFMFIMNLLRKKSEKKLFVVASKISRTEGVKINYSSMKKKRN